MTKCYIRSLGHYVPPKVVTNRDIEQLMNTSDEWIQQRSGIRERRWAEPGETVNHMAVEASKEALGKAGVDANEIDCIVFGSLVTDYVFPGGGVLLQRGLGITRTIPAYDVRTQCSAFPYTLQMSDALIRTGVYKKILLVGAELQTTSIDKSPRGRDVGVLFGDGAGALVLEAAPAGSKSFVIDTVVHSQGEHAEKLFLKNPSPTNFPRIGPDTVIDESYFPHMEGRQVFKNAIERMCEVIHEICKKNGFSVSDIDFVIAHQANMRINQMVLENLGIPAEKTHNTVERYGNTTAATIPITMNEAVDQGKIKRGDLVACVAFGAGFTWGASLLRF